MARTRTTKAVAQRIDLNYFKRATPFKRARLWLAILAPLAALLWISWPFGGRDNRVYSAGRLSQAHVVLEKQCAACHVPQAGGFSAKAADSACLACHDGPAHHPDATAGNAPKLACAACHIEHRGRMNLSAASTRGCAECHSDLAVAGTGSRYAKTIKSFEDGHPEFACFRSVAGVTPNDPGTIKLNHALHMKLIRRGTNGPMVQLECGNCHNSSAATPDLSYADAKYRAESVSYTEEDLVLQIPRETMKPPRPITGRELMAPVKFANACAACHLLTFDKRFEDGVPHDKPEVVQVFLMKKFSEYIAAHPRELQEVQDPQRKLAGRGVGPAVRSLSSPQWVKEQVAVAEELLWHKTCSQCHKLSATPLQDVKIARWDAAGRLGAATAFGGAPLTDAKLPTVAAAQTTIQWLPHARFDHDAHTGFSCVGCHANALKSAESSDILIPGIAVCQTCHVPGPGHASSQCSECHTYHDWSRRKEVKPKFLLPELRRGGN